MPYPYDWFGWALSTGDFDGNGGRDLAIAAKEDVEAGGHGTTTVLFGTSEGLTAIGDQLISQNSPGIKGTGWSRPTSLRGGDFDGDGFWDLAIGNCTDDDVQGFPVGSTQIIYGSSSGLSDRDLLWLASDFFTIGDAENSGFGDVGSRGLCL